MLDNVSRKIIETELKRMQQAYEAAQDKYAYGSKAAARTMDKYSVLMIVLEKALAPSKEDALRMAVAKAQNEVREQHRRGRMSDETYSAICKALEVRTDE